MPKILVAVRLLIAGWVQLVPSRLATMKLVGLAVGSMFPAEKLKAALYLLKTIPTLAIVQKRFTSWVEETPELAMSGCSPGDVLAMRFPAVVTFVKITLTGA